MVRRLCFGCIVFLWFVWLLWRLNSMKWILSIDNFGKLFIASLFFGFVIAFVRFFRTPLYRQVNILLLGITLISIPLITAPSTIVQLSADTKNEKIRELKAAEKEYGKWWHITYIRGRKISEKQLTDEEVRSKQKSAIGPWFFYVIMYVIPFVVGTIIIYSSTRKILLHRQNIKGTYLDSKENV